MTKTQRGPFTSWLLKQESRNDLVGELAEEVLGSSDWPLEDSLLACRVYMARDEATPLAMYALQMAYLEWEKTKHLPDVNTYVPPMLKHGVN